MSHHDAEDAIRRILKLTPGNPAGPCPDANDLAAYLESRLSPAESTQFEEHAADCSSCREALALSLQLSAEETEYVTAPAPEAKTFSYRTSPLRLAFAGVVLLMVGAILFRATREVPVAKPVPQVAVNQVLPNVSGGSGASMSPAAPSPRSAGTAASVPSAPLTEAMRAGAISAATPARRPAQPAVTKLPLAYSVADAGSINRPQPAVAAQEISRKATGDAVVEMAKVRPVAAEDPLTKDKALARPDELKPQVIPASQASNQMALTGAQNTLPSPQNFILQNQNAALSNQIDTKNQVTPPAAPVTQQVTSDRAEVAQAQKGQAVVKPAGVNMMAKEAPLAMRRSAAAVSDPVRKALVEARVMQLRRVEGKEVQKAGARLLYRTPDAWVDAQCLEHADAPTRVAARNGKEQQEVLAKEPAIGQLDPSDLPVLIYWNGTNLLLVR
jgi:hypothetical protein